MAAHNKIVGEEQRSEFLRRAGSIPWFKAPEKRHYRAKVFKSGNSLAVRLPAGTELSAGMEMELTVEDGKFLSLEPVDVPKRKFNVAKVAGSAPGLALIRDGDRVFEERPLFGEDGGMVDQSDPRQ